ncbi:MAG: 30S ribosomal protein S4, partial [Planctomycetes bacterium]|nr:30S ribosomal protein S4 [Planctomycetota bacterium]
MVKKQKGTCKLCRREATKLYLKGQRCDGPKCAMQNRNFQPGMHSWTRGRPSEYRIRLREKQKAKRFYGVGDKQFKLYVSRANRAEGNSGEQLLIILERRLDNVIYSLGLTRSRKEARQMISHRHFLLNGKRCDIPSALVRPNDKVRAADKPKGKKLIEAALEFNKNKTIPSWLDRDDSQLGGIVREMPKREHVQFEIEE